jgi:hypothetical protein
MSEMVNVESDGGVPGSGDVLSRSSGFFMHARPEIGKAIWRDDHAEIVIRTARLSAEDAEEFDMFAFADFGGWEVWTRPPQTPEETAACEALARRIAARRRAAEETAREMQRLAEEKRRADEGERARYAEWRFEHLEHLQRTWTYPDELRGQGEECVDWSQAAGWYTTGDHYTRHTIDGRTVWHSWYGNTSVVYAPADLVERWYRARWEREQHDRIELRRSLNQVQSPDYFGCVGYDYAAWLAANVGEVAIAALLADESEWDASYRRDGTPALHKALREFSYSFGSIREGRTHYRVWANPGGVERLRAAGFTVEPLAAKAQA